MSDEKKPRDMLWIWEFKDGPDITTDIEPQNYILGGEKCRCWIPKSSYMRIKLENEDLEVRLKRTVNAAYHALLEMSAWLGVPEKKRRDQIDYLMKNVKYCAANDLRDRDEVKK